MKNTSISTLLFVILAAAFAPFAQSFTGPRNMGSVINSASDEQAASITPNGLSLYFTSNRPGGLGGQDIYVSQRSALNTPWGPPQNLGPAINSPQNDVTPTFSRDGLVMFFASERTAGGFGLNDIYRCTRVNANDDSGWSTPENLGPPINTQFSERGPTYFEDPVTGVRTLVFAREPVIPADIPFHDLYQSKEDSNGTFNTPVPIVELNSIGTEIRAAIRSDGLEVFIHTSRPGIVGPMGSFDIFRSTRQSTSEPWEPPVRLAELNTTGNEGGPALSPDGAVLFLQSNRPGGLGGNDLYTATRCSSYTASPCYVDRTVSDFNADGITDLSIFRPSDGTWWVEESGTTTVSVRQFGASGDRIVPGDYDGDGRLDLAVFRPSDPAWWILRSSDSSFTVTQFGLSTDLPAPGDYDGDGKTDITVYRGGTWYIRRSSAGDLVRRFGLSGDVPVAGVQ